MQRRICRLVIFTAACLAVGAPAAGAQSYAPGAAGIGDPYFPLEGNGGYDVRHYDLTFSYDPASDRLDALNKITARATQNLSRFDLDFQQLTVKGVDVDDEAASFTRDGQELVITPAQGIATGSTFTVNVRYAGVPQTIVGSPIVFGSPYGFIHTDDGAFMGDEPNATSTWIPMNDHPSDKATWTFHVTVPAGLEVVANGRLVKQSQSAGESTWVWDEPYPMSNYLATADIGQWNFKNGKTPGGIPETVALDPTLLTTNPSAMDFFFDTTAEATDLWNDTFGPYPFDSTGAIAVRTWKHIWLNEGFASFAQYLWNEHLGVRTGHEDFLLDYSRPATDPL